ncbi:receptor-like serine/threonine-protein kinase ALE2 isoform X2 [Rhodamnia argentea]|uniref:Receptor-like serine/threonine-protein kinase ALE2 isoform X2 n=1 Tax=Rhodamnia argentea TaxID=178133 RepID=A0ABM3H9I5_9MYRT|nr:receptor-like serine/threonine-protein kinase ALE2 isoform X2 [Rhodamnia argentea]
MGVVMQVIIAQLVQVCIITFASAVQGSAGYNISPSTDNFSAIPPIGAEPPAHQMKSLKSSAPSSLDGSTLRSPLAAPPLLSSSPSPDQRSPVQNAPSPISQPNGSILQPPLASPPLSALPPPKTTELVPLLSPSNPSSFFPHLLAPPPMSTERGVLAPPPSKSPEKAPVHVTPAVSVAPAPTLTPRKHSPAQSPVDNASIPATSPPAGHQRNDSAGHSPVPEASVPTPFPSPPRKIGQSPPAEHPVMPHIAPPVPPVPAASPSNEGTQNSPSVHPHAPEESPSIEAGHHMSPALPPLKERDKMPAAPPSNNAATDLSPAKHPPKVHKAGTPAPSLLPPPSEGHRSPASLPPASFVNHRHTRKAILPPSHSPLPSTDSSGGVAPSPHKTGHIYADAPLPPPPLPSSTGHPISAKSPLPSSNMRRVRGNKISSPPPFSDHRASSPGPVSAPATLPQHKQRHNTSPSPSPGSLVSPPHFTNPPSKSDLPLAPSPSPRTASGHPKIPPSKPPSTNLIVAPPPPIRALPPPPPNQDCSTTTCMEPYTNTPPGSPCGCVWPMQVGLRLSVALYTFFPLVSELAEEIASGVFMKQSQVRIMGANAATEQPEKTIVLIDLVPLGDEFDNTTAFLTFERFWHKQIFINTSYFGDYEVLYVRYPGLPASPPLPPDAAIIDGGPYSANDNNARTNKPLGVDVQRGQHNHGLSGGAVAIIVLSALVAVVLCSVAGWIWIMKHRDRVFRPAPTPQALLPSVAKSPVTAGPILGSGPSSASLSFGSSIPTYAGSARTLSVSDIERATDHFNESRILGEGGFGRVYSGILEDGTKVAVKVLKREDQQGGREFLAEVEMLSRLHHRNLVKLIGICTEERVRCLVYELIPNGSVESHLHGVDKEAAPLDWGARMKIALGAARGLAYLHEDSSPRVIHRDFKASNILLEHDFTPKVSDFGLARTAMDEENRHISTRVMGTFGYVAPEYAMTGHLLVKSDVYSYGVVLLELLTGRKPVDMSQPPGQENLVAWARPLLTSREGLEAILDPCLGPTVPFDSVAKVAAIASMCVQPEVSHRPFMGEVVQALKLVCNECECGEAREAGSRSYSREDLSIDLDPKAGAGSGPSQHPLHGRYSDPDYDSVSNSERGVSVSDFLGTAGYTRPISISFRRYSSSGSLRVGRGRHFWERLRRLSGGSASEHGGTFLGLWPGSN